MSKPPDARPPDPAGQAQQLLALLDALEFEPGALAPPLVFQPLADDGE